MLALLLAQRMHYDVPTEFVHYLNARQSMLLDVGDTVLVSHRRMFQHDEARFFVGALIAADHELLKLEGYTFVRDLSSGMVIRKDERRIKLLSLANDGYIFYQIPGKLNVADIQVANQAGEVTLVVGSQTIMNLSERSHSGHI